VLPKPLSVDAWLEQLGQPAADRNYLPGHARIHALLNTCALRRPKLRIRVAGTNGKGSTCFMLAQALQHSGLKVGLYTSPHILRFHERIRVNQTPISNDELHELLEHIMPEALRIGASYFEVATVLAWLYFSKQQVDVEILEAGVGARLDATTALPADAGILTPVGLDHEAWLGTDLLSIAEEKTHIFQGCDIQVSAAQAPSIHTWLHEHAPHVCIAPCSDEQPKHLLGDHQRINAGIAWQTLQLLHREKKLAFDLNAAHQSMMETHIPARLQAVRYGEASLLLDAAHNRHAVEALIPFLSQQQAFDAILVYTRDDRDLSDCFSLLKPYTDLLISDRDGATLCMASVEDALHYVVQRQPQARVVVLGSFLTVASCLRLLD